MDRSHQRFWKSKDSAKHGHSIVGAMKTFSIRGPEEIRERFLRGCEKVGLEEQVTIRALITAFTGTLEL